MFMYKIRNIFTLLVSICFFSFLGSKEVMPAFFIEDLPLLGKVIYVDPGHGGLDPGAVYKDIYEKDINLEISVVLKEELENLGATVYLTRSGDYDLASPNASYRKQSDLLNRSKLVNNSNCDLYLSIHLNSISSSTWSGAQTFYDDINDLNKIIAEYIQDSLIKNLNTKRTSSNIEDMYMYKHTEKPGVLIEAGFLSNSNDRYLLQQEDYQIELSKAIIEGIINYFYQ